jgi:hypothetical protein
MHLYTSEAHAPGTIEARKECWANTPTEVSTEMNNELVREVTLKEVQDAITVMPKDNAPGSDAIRNEFFQEFIKEIALTLRHGSTESLLQRCQVCIAALLHCCNAARFALLQCCNAKTWQHYYALLLCCRIQAMTLSPPQATSSRWSRFVRIPLVEPIN